MATEKTFLGAPVIPFGMRTRLSLMMFLQFLLMPAWNVPLYSYVADGLGSPMWAFWCVSLGGIGVFTSPIICMVADRFYNSERVLAVCNFICAALLISCRFVQDPALLFLILLVMMLIYMPTWSLVTVIAMTHTSTAAFPQFRVFAPLGWVAGGFFSVIGVKLFGIANFDMTSWTFVAGGLTAAVAGICALTLPATPPKGRGEPMRIADALGLKAFGMFRSPQFLVFAVLVFLAMVPFQWFMCYNTQYLKEKGFQFLTLTTNLAQFGEVFLTLLIPLILKKCGYKWTMVIGLGGLTFRYAMLTLGATTGCEAFDIAGIVVHGFIYGLIIVGAQMYVDETAPVAIRNQAQGLIVLITTGFGVFASNAVFHALLRHNEIIDAATKAVTHNWQPPYIFATIFSAILIVLMAVFFRPNRGNAQGTAEKA